MASTEDMKIGAVDVSTSFAAVLTVVAPTQLGHVTVGLIAGVLVGQRDRTDAVEVIRKALIVDLDSLVGDLEWSGAIWLA